MSRLGAWPRPETTDFPDPTSLKALPQLPSNDFYSFGLVQSWSSSLEPISKQVICHILTLYILHVHLSYKLMHVHVHVYCVFVCLMLVWLLRHVHVNI